MTNAYLLAGIAMLFWGIAPIFGKLALGNVSPLAALAIRSLVVSALLVAAVTATGHWGSVAGATAKDTMFIALEVICAALLGQLAYYYALKFGEVGRVSPLVAAFPLVAVLAGIVFLGEKLSAAKIAAAILIVSGIALLKY